MNWTKRLTLVLSLLLIGTATAQNIEFERGTFMLRKSGTNQYLGMKKEGSLWTPYFEKGRENANFWRIESEGGRSISLRSSNRYLAFEVFGENHQLKGESPKQGGNPKWVGEVSDNEKVVFKEQVSGLYLTNVSDGNVFGTTNKSEALEFEVIDGGSRIGTPNDLSDDWYFLEFRFGSKKITSSKGIENGDIAEMTNSQYGRYSQWKIIEMPDGYHIQNRKNKLYLTANGAVRKVPEFD